jgi:two-component system NarL family sensor kinase
MITDNVILALSFAAFVLFPAFVLMKRQRFLFEHRSHLQQSLPDNDQRILQAEISAREHAMRQISMEIHDNIAHSLALCKLQLNALVTTQHATCNDELNHAGLLLSNALNSVSNLSHQLSGQVIEQDSLPEAVNKTLNFFACIRDVKVNLEIQGSPYSLGSSRELHIYRIVQEAMHNILKHARASTANIVLDYSDQQFKCSIKDNGIGFDQRDTLKSAGAGLSNMRKRALLVGADIGISSIPGNGTLIHIYLPLLNRN